ncbi:MAG TPA: thiamine pyrophosphate-dependent enzyme [Actinomycetes bacterium]|nr:thiamine pyrophosphate-dependent enzyme [Actinomycetes bacterium]
MEEIVGEALATRLVEWGVDTVFGLPGDGINGLMEGFRRRRDALRFVLVHHEEAAAFMATGYAKATGRLGVCVATSGPGGIHLLNGLYDAKLDHVPVLALTGMQASDVLGSAYQQEVHLDRLFADVAAYNLLVTNPRQMPAVVDLAVRTALARQTVAHLTFPNDLQVAPAAEDPYAHVGPGAPPQSMPLTASAELTPRQDDLARAAAVLNAGRAVVMLVGEGARGASADVVAVADRLGAPIVKTLKGKAVVPDEHPLTTGGIGLLGTRPSEEAMENADTLLMVGTSFPYATFLPEPGKVRAVQIDVDATRIGMRVPVEAPVVADSARALRALLPMLEPASERGFLRRAQEGMTKWRADMAAMVDPKRSPIAPEYLMGCLDEVAAEDAILTCDSGTVATWAARHWNIRAGRQLYLSGNLATMACGLPYAIGMQSAFPDRQVIAYVGDGGFAMLMAELLTAVRHELPLTVIVNNNNSYGMILWEQLLLGFPEYAVRHRPPVADFAAWARACGAHAEKVSEAAGLKEAVRVALAHPGVALVDVDVDPNEPPMPGKVTYQQAKAVAEAFLHGQPHKREMVAAVARDTIAQMFG